MNLSVKQQWSNDKLQCSSAAFDWHKRYYKQRYFVFARRNNYSTQGPIGFYARSFTSINGSSRSYHNTKRLLRRLWQTNCWPSNHSSWTYMASGALYMQSLLSRIGNTELFWARRSSVLRTRLSQFVQPTLCLLQRRYFGQMCHSSRQDMAHRTFLLCAMWTAIRRRWLPWTWW